MALRSGIQSRFGLLSLVAYLGLGMLGLLVAMLGSLPPARGFWIEFGVALGFIGIAMMGLQFLLTARFPSLSGRFGQDTLLHFHKHAGLIAAGCVLSHPIVLIAADPAFIEFFDPRSNAPRAFALVTVTLMVIALISTTLLRPQLAIKYEWWRLMHGGLASFIMLIGLAHIMRVQHYISTPIQQIIVILLVLAPVALLLYVRVLRPWLAKRKPYRVAAVHQERERVWTITLEAVDHRSFPFRPGQFAWITVGDTPLSLQQHPFTIASSAEAPARLSFTIKELGDFTSTIGSIVPGSSAYLEGPAGSFVVPDSAGSAVYIAGGIGVTPAMSILRTARDRNDDRPFMLFYGNETIEKAVFADELRELSSQLNLQIILVPESPPADWPGPHGYIDRDILSDHLTEKQINQAHFMICGPDRMIDAVEQALLDLGVDSSRIRSERFNIV